jgi:preprotein translocase subunit SecB
MPVVLAMEGLEVPTEDLDMDSMLVVLTINIIARARINNGSSHLVEVSEEGILRIMHVSMEFVERGA